MTHSQVESGIMFLRKHIAVSPGFLTLQEFIWYKKDPLDLWGDPYHSMVEQWHSSRDGATFFECPLTTPSGSSSTVVTYYSQLALYGIITGVTPINSHNGIHYSNRRVEIDDGAPDELPQAWSFWNPLNML